MRSLSRAAGICAAAAVLVAGVLPFAAVPAASAAPVCDTSWAGFMGGGGVWNTGSWTNGVPTATSHACLPDAGTPYTVLVTGSAVAKQLTVGQNAQLVIVGDSSDGNAALTVGSGGLSTAASSVLRMTSSDASFDTTLTVASGAKAVINGTFESDQGTGGNRFVHAALVNNTLVSINANTVMYAPLTNTGEIRIAANDLLYAPKLTNYQFSTHTLTGGTYTLDGILAVPGLDVRTLSAVVTLDNGNAELQNAPSSNGLGHLSTTTIQSNLRLLGGTLSVPTFTANGLVAVGSGATLRSSGPITIGRNGQLETADGSTVRPKGTLTVNGSMRGAGSVQGSLVVNGGVSPVSAQAFGSLAVTGNYTQAPTSGIVYVFQNSFTTTPITVAGTATLAGYVVLSQIQTAGNGQVQQVISAAHRTGTFGDVSFAVFTDGQRPVLQYSGTAAQLVSTSVLQDDDLRVGYQHWSGQIDPLDSARWMRSSSHKGDAMSFTFTGPTVAMTLLYGPAAGRAQVTIDGKAKGTLDTYEAALDEKTLSYSGLGSGKHTLSVRVAGSKNPASTGSSVSVISFRDSITDHDLADPMVSIPGWTRTTNAGALGGTYMSAAAAGHSVTVPFTGTGVNWVTQECPACGVAQVSVDNGFPVTENLYSASTLNEVVVHFPAQSSGNHTVTVTVTGTKVAPSTGTTVVVDAFVPTS